MADDSSELWDAVADDQAQRVLVKQTLVRRIDAPASRINYALGRGFRCTVGQAFLDRRDPGDELWVYCSNPDTWKRLCGRAGFAIVRSGEVVDFYQAIIN